MKKNKVWGIVIIIAVIICFGVLFVSFLGNDLKGNGRKTSEVSSNLYLTANYEMLMYEHASEYVHNKFDIDNMKENEEVQISSENLFKDVDISDEYKYCSGSFIVKKTINNILVYKFSSECDNSSDKEINAEILMYENINFEASNRYYSLYDAFANNYFIREFDIEKETTSDGETVTYGGKIDGIRGFVRFDNNLNLVDINEFNEREDGITARAYSSDKYYYISNFDASTNESYIKIYDNELNFISIIEDNDFTDYITSVDDILYYGYWGTLKKYNINNKAIDKEIKLDDRKTAYIEYNDGILYSYSAPQYGTKLYKYDMEGNVINSIDPVEYYYSSDFGIDVFANKDYYFLVPRNYSYDMNYFIVLDNNGDVVNKVNITENFHFEDIVTDDNGYTLVFEGQIPEDGVIKNYYELFNYDSSHRLLNYKLINRDYAKELLKENGYDTTYEYKWDTKLFDNKVVETFYFDENNGTEIFIKYS